MLKWTWIQTLSTFTSQKHNGAPQKTNWWKCVRCSLECSCINYGLGEGFLGRGEGVGDSGLVRGVGEAVALDREWEERSAAETGSLRLNFWRIASFARIFLCRYWILGCGEIEMPHLLLEETNWSYEKHGTIPRESTWCYGKVRLTEASIWALLNSKCNLLNPNQYWLLNSMVQKRNLWWK